MTFVHLHNHTAHSVLDGLQKMPEMVATAVADRQPAQAITDHGSLAGVWDFYTECKRQGVKPIIGIEGYMAIADDTRKERSRFDPKTIEVPASDDFDGSDATEIGVTRKKSYEHITLLVKNATGWKNLVTMHNEAERHSFWRKPLYDYALFRRFHEGLIVGTGCLGGPVAGNLLRAETSRATADTAKRVLHGELYGAHVPPALRGLSNDELHALIDTNTAAIEPSRQQAEQELLTLIDIFGRDNVFVEVMDHDIPAERAIIGGLIALANKHGVLAAATNDCHYTHDHQQDTHDAWLCVSQKRGGKTVTVSDENRFKFNGTGYHQRTEDEMRAIFDHIPGCEDVVSNTALIADMVEDDVLGDIRLRLPHFDIDKMDWKPTTDIQPIKGCRIRDDGKWEFDSNYDAFYSLVRDGACRLYGTPFSSELKARLRREMDVITSKGFIDYFLIVWDFIDWASSDRGYPTDEFPRGEPGQKRPIVTGVGRGCLTGDVPVWTTRGYVPISDVVTGDVVRTHTGALRPVECTFAYDVDEELVNIRSRYDDGRGVTLTKDHKVLVVRSEHETNKTLLASGHRFISDPSNSPEWVDASSIKEGDLVVVPRPPSPGIAPEQFDLSTFGRGEVDGGVIRERFGWSVSLRSSKRDIARRFGISRNAIKNVFDGRAKKVTEDRLLAAVQADGFRSIEHWQKYLNEHRQHETVSPANLTLTEDLCWLIGAWVSNGWTRKSSNREVGWATRRSTDDGTLADMVERVLGVRPSLQSSATSDLHQYRVSSGSLHDWIMSWAEGYDYTALTKHLPAWFSDMTIEQKQAMLDGLWWGDGSERRYCTSSPVLAGQVRDLLWSVGLPAGVSLDERTDHRPGFTNRSTGYRITSTTNRKPMTMAFGWSDDSYVYQRVTSVETVTEVRKVYDLQVPEDHSFMTGSYVVHNSGPGSLIAYCTGITAVEPLEHGLLFERFLDPSRLDFPDFDTDFEGGRRDEVVKYLEHRYGSDHVALMGTWMMGWAKRAIKDMARVTDRGRLGNRLSEAMVVGTPPEKFPLSDLMKREVGNEANEQFISMVENDPEAAQLISDAQEIEGVVAGVSIHACGTVIGDEPLETLIPMRWSRGDKSADHWVTQWDPDGIGEDGFGLIKFDLLSIQTLDVVSKCIEMIERDTGEHIDYRHLPFEGERAEKVWHMLADGRTSGVFQLASDGMTELCQKVGPETFGDLSALVALYRPGPMGAGMHEAYARRKRGAEPVSYDNYTRSKVEQDVIAESLGGTFGLIVYQEQLMSLARNIADFSDKEVNLLRKAFSKKKEDLMQSLYERWIDGGMSDFRRDWIDHGNDWAKLPDGSPKPHTKKVPFQRSTLDELWRTFEASAAYLFNRSHSYAYGYTSYLTAYLKANFPSYFGAATLSVIPRNSSEKRRRALDDLAADGVTVLPPDVNKGEVDTSVDEDGHVRFGLSEVSGVGNAAEYIVAERKRNGPFTSLGDLMDRVKLPNTADSLVLNKKVSTTTLEGLVESGALDGFGPRLGLMTRVRAPHGPVPDLEWGDMERAARQRMRINTHIGESPLMSMHQQIALWREPAGRGAKPIPLQKIPMEHGAQVVTLGIATSFREKKIKTGTMCFLSLEGSNRTIDVVMFPRAYEGMDWQPQVGQIIGITGRTEITEVPGSDDEGNEEARSRLSIIASDYWVGPLVDHSTGNMGGAFPSSDEPAPSGAPEPVEAAVMGGRTYSLLWPHGKQWTTVINSGPAKVALKKFLPELQKWARNNMRNEGATQQFHNEEYDVTLSVTISMDAPNWGKVAEFTEFMTFVNSVM